MLHSLKTLWTRLSPSLASSPVKSGVLALAGGTVVSSAAVDDPVKYVYGVARFGVAAYYLVPIISDWKLHEFRAQNLSEDDADADASATHTTIANRLRDLCLAQGGIYTKAGQHICAQPVMLPEYISSLRVLMDEAHIDPFEVDRATFTEELKKTPEESFAHFERQPLASASLAQVYKAKLHDGRTVAVKIQRRPVARFLEIDLSIIEVFYKFLAAAIPGLNLEWLAAESRRHLLEELDFETEADNADRARALLTPEFPPDKLYIPDVIRNLSGKRVLTMDFAEGVPVDKIMAEGGYGHGPGGQKRKAEVAQLVQQVFASMIFIHGFVHCDPHPGNMLVDRTGRLVLLDHGVYRTLDPELRRCYGELWMAVIRGNKQAMQDWTEALGVSRRLWRFMAMTLAIAPGKVDADGTSDLMGHIKPVNQYDMDDHHAALQEVAALGFSLEDLTGIFRDMPKDLLLVLKTNNLLRYVNDELGAPVNRFQIIAQYVPRGLKSVSGQWKADDRGTKPMLQMLRTNLDQIWIGLCARIYPVFVRIGERIIKWNLQSNGRSASNP